MAELKKKTASKKENVKKKKHGLKQFIISLQESPIKYFSDLFIVAMVLVWIFTIIAMIAMGIYSTIAHADNSIWTDLGALVAVPLSAGGAIWMIKNSVQHAILNKRGIEAPADFAAVNVEGECSSYSGTEEQMQINIKNDNKII